MVYLVGPAPLERRSHESARKSFPPVWAFGVDIHDMRRFPGAQATGDWALLAQQSARSRDDMAVAFEEPSNILASRDQPGEPGFRGTRQLAGLVALEQAHVHEHRRAVTSNDQTILERCASQRIRRALHDSVPFCG